MTTSVLDSKTAMSVVAESRTAMPHEMPPSMRNSIAQYMAEVEVRKALRTRWPAAWTRDAARLAAFAAMAYLVLQVVA